MSDPLLSSKNNNSVAFMEAAFTDSTSSKPAENPISNVLKQSAHPTVLLFHFGFRTAATIVYLFLGWFVHDGGSIFVFVITTLLLALDFWQVKNVSGRLLVGLRWWQEQTDKGTKWIFESRANNNSNQIDAKCFWWSLYGYLGIWLFFGLTALVGLHFFWFTLVAIAIVLNGINLIGYIKCDRDARKRSAVGIQTSWLSSLMPFLK